MTWPFPCCFGLFYLLQLIVGSCGGAFFTTPWLLLRDFGGAFMAATSLVAGGLDSALLAAT